jgi:hypothetical protein
LPLKSSFSEISQNSKEVAKGFKRSNTMEDTSMQTAKGNTKKKPNKRPNWSGIALIIGFAEESFHINSKR